MPIHVSSFTIFSLSKSFTTENAQKMRLEYISKNMHKLCVYLETSLPHSLPTPSVNHACHAPQCLLWRFLNCRHGILMCNALKIPQVLWNVHFSSHYQTGPNSCCNTSGQSITKLLPHCHECKALWLKAN